MQSKRQGQIIMVLCPRLEFSTSTKELGSLAFAAHIRFDAYNYAVCPGNVFVQQGMEVMGRWADDVKLSWLHDD
jgi:hypothetical protein